MAPVSFVDLAKGRGAVLEEKEIGIRWGSSYVEEG